MASPVKPFRRYPKARVRRYNGGVKENLFLEEGTVPVQASIAAALGDKLGLYERVIGAAPGFILDWKHYGRKYGWKLKAHDGAKALFELTVTAGDFRVSVAAREAEMQALRGDPASAAILERLLPPGKSKEGWGIRLSIADEGACADAVALIGAVAGIRQRG